MTASKPITIMNATRFTVRLLTPKANAKLVLGRDGTTNISTSAAKAIAIAASTAVDAILAMFFSAIEVVCCHATEEAIERRS